MRTTTSLPTPPPHLAAALPRGLAMGFLYWLVFLLSLEPDNIARAWHAGAGLKFSQETVRILGASLLGCAATPLLMEQVRRFPIEGAHRWRNVFLQCVGSVVVAAGLVAVSCLLADRFIMTEHRPLGVALREEFIANGALVTFCVAGFVALAHAVRFFEQAQAERSRPVERPERYMTTIPVRERGHVTLLDVAEVDWIETQGNYMAVHAGAKVHLIRESLARVEARLDPAHFVRVHRRVLVAADRIATVRSLGAGDAQLRLKDGVELRLSRTYRDRIEVMLKAGR